MKVLFISSGNSREGISMVVKEQGNSLSEEDIQIENFRIIGKGLAGYLKNIFSLRKIVSTEKYDILHAHYSLSGIMATFARQRRPLIVSLMGSDVNEYKWLIPIIRWFTRKYWDACIVKSTELKDNLDLERISIIPNGVDLNFFNNIGKQISISKLNWEKNKLHLLFAANPDRKVKNFQLTEKSVKFLQNVDIDIHYIKNVDFKMVSYYYNAADVVILTSLWEGSPNVIKEAMACNRPIVSTDVGDVRWLFGNEPGHFITTFDPEDVAEKILLALDFEKNQGGTNGRNRIAELGLDSETVANRIIKVYNDVLTVKSINE